MGALHLGLLGLLAASPGSYDFNGVKASATQVRPLGFFNGGDGFVSGVGAFTLGATDHVRDDSLTYGDKAVLSARIVVGADEYQVDLPRAGFPPLQTLPADEQRAGKLPPAPRHPTGGGVLLDRDVFGASGIGVSTLTGAHAAVAVFGVGRVFKNGALLTDRARVQATALPAGIFSEAAGIRMADAPRPGHAEVVVIADNLPRQVVPRGFIQFGFNDVAIVVNGAPVAGVAQAAPAENAGVGGAGMQGAPLGVIDLSGTPDSSAMVASGNAAPALGSGGAGSDEGTGYVVPSGPRVDMGGPGGVASVTGAPSMNDQLRPSISQESLSTAWGGTSGAGIGGAGTAGAGIGMAGPGATGAGGYGPGPVLGLFPAQTGVGLSTGGTVAQGAATSSRDAAEAVNGRTSLPSRTLAPNALPANATPTPVPNSMLNVSGPVVVAPAGTATSGTATSATPGAPAVGTPGAPAVGTPGAPGALGQTTTGGAAVGGASSSVGETLPGSPRSVASQSQVPGNELNAPSAFSSFGIPATPRPLNADPATPLPFTPSPLNATSPTGLPSTTGAPATTQPGAARGGTVGRSPSTVPPAGGAGTVSGVGGGPASGGGVVSPSPAGR